MAGIADFCETVRAWLGREVADYGDPLVTSWVRIAESEISDRLRIRENMTSASVTITGDEGALPDDYAEAYLILNAVKRPMKRMPTEDYMVWKKNRAATVANYFTTVGSTIYAGGGQLDGATLDVFYYARVPALEDSDNWLVTKWPQLLLAQTMAAAELYGVDDERATSLASTAASKIEQLNATHRISTASGSRMRARPKSLG